MRIFFFGLLLHIIVVNNAMSCPKFCECKWKSGKTTAECVNKSLSEIPDNIDSETQVLNFAENKLGKLTEELFQKKDLLNLQRLFLSKCQIKFIHKETFKGLTNLVEIDLSNNFLDTVPTLAFMNCPSLMKLTLNANPIDVVKKLAFNHLSYLKTLQLNGCEIADIEEGAFQGLQSLESLDLDSNHLKTINGPNTLPKTLRGIELQNNPWTCDCHIRDFHDWLKDFNLPLLTDPLCNEPQKLKNLLIKNVDKDDLACLPDVSPTTFYLELDEGKNVSLLCHVYAIPEASVSWWFDGQLLQNNTKIAPGIRLMYFIEDGSENKRSELFIYNANAEDNGTYVCHAENAAGTAQSNFTIKIILKEDPIVVVVPFSIEYMLISVIGASVIVLILIISLVVCLIRCHRQKKRLLKRDQTKEVALHLQQNQNDGNKNWATKSISSSPLDQQLKINNITPTTQTTTSTSESEEILLYDVRICQEDQFNQTPNTPNRTVNRNLTTIQHISPLSLRRYQLEQNPDLINGTESIKCRRSGDGEDNSGGVRQRGEEVVEATTGVSCLRSSAEFYADQNGSSGGGMRQMIDHQGYPLDYGLPKMCCRSSSNEACYRTLPCNRMKRHSAANPPKRYSREVEFLSRSIDSPYDRYHTSDIRYTADGYPVFRQNIISPNTSSSSSPPPPLSLQLQQQIPTPLPSSSSSSSIPCCSVKWPPCLPGKAQILTTPPPPLPLPLPTASIISKKCASAQTETTENDCVVTPRRGDDVIINMLENEDDNVNGDLVRESPDEGYEGESSVVLGKIVPVIKM